MQKECKCRSRYFPDRVAGSDPLQEVPSVPVRLVFFVQSGAAGFLSVRQEILSGCVPYRGTRCMARFYRRIGPGGKSVFHFRTLSEIIVPDRPNGSGERSAGPCPRRDIGTHMVPPTSDGRAGTLRNGDLSTDGKPAAPGRNAAIHDIAGAFRGMGSNFSGGRTSFVCSGIPSCVRERNGCFRGRRYGPFVFYAYLRESVVGRIPYFLRVSFRLQRRWTTEPKN